MPVDCLLYLYFTFNSNLDENFKLYPVNNGRNLRIDSKVLDRDVSTLILEFNRKAKKMLLSMALLFETFAFSYCAVMILLNGAYIISFHSLFVLCVIMPFYIFYMSYGKYYFLTLLIQIVINNPI